jgi:hypothetical protein
LEAIAMSKLKTGSGKRKDHTHFYVALIQMSVVCFPFGLLIYFCASIPAPLNRLSAAFFGLGASALGCGSLALVYKLSGESDANAPGDRND